jgi:hypothetical protein
VSDDLVKRLRDACYLVFDDNTHDYCSAIKAAVQIESFNEKLIEAEQRGYANAMDAERKLHESRIKQLEKALREIAETSDLYPLHWAAPIARAALGEKKDAPPT